MFQRSSRAPSRRWFRLAVAAGLLSSTLLTTVTASGAQPASADDPAVITIWHKIAVNTITNSVAQGGAGKANAEGVVWFAYVQAAVYNAVVGITHDYDLYKWNARGPTTASPEASAAVAAHRVLMTYFGADPTIATNLDAALATSLAAIPDGVSKNQGIRYGERAADRLIELRANDGRFAAVTFDMRPAPGVWRPTPPANAPFHAPWLSQLEPFTMDASDQFRPGPPPPISSALYVEEFNEVRDYGSKTSALRTADQTNLARFCADVAIKPLQVGLRDLVTRQGLSISESARVIAAVNMSVADSLIAVWDGKVQYLWWRPITAIREADTDGNDATVGVPTWEPLITTPPYPDWPSGLGAVVGAMSTTLSRLNPNGVVDMTIFSPGTGITLHYDDPLVMQHDVINARVWSGIHFRTADEVGAAMGVNVANQALDRYFAPSK